MAARRKPGAHDLIVSAWYRAGRGYGLVMVCLGADAQGITFALPRVRVSVLPGPAIVRFSRGVIRPQFANGGIV